jgi:hypothetical protein
MTSTDLLTHVGVTAGEKIEILQAGVRPTPCTFVDAIYTADGVPLVLRVLLASSDDLWIVPWTSVLAIRKVLPE